MIRPAQAVYWRGHWFDAQTAAMLQELAATSGSIYVRPIQGCWSTATTNSQGTHAKACVVDLDCEDLTDAEAVWLETAWRRMGGFGWFRPRKSPSGYVYGWQRHAHLAHPDGDMSAELADQWDDYRADLNGLANNGPDTGTRAYVGATWAKYLQQKEQTVTPEQLATILARIDALPQKVWRFPLVNRITKKSWSAGSYLEGANILAGQGLTATKEVAARSAAVLDRLTELADAGEPTSPELVDELRQLLGSVRLQLVPITEEGTPA